MLPQNRYLAGNGVTITDNPRAKLAAGAKRQVPIDIDVIHYTSAVPFRKAFFLRLSGLFDILMAFYEEKAISMTYEHCLLCPRECGVNRSAGELGFCGCPGEALVAKTMIHKWEEPALAGNGGSGAIFFGGCTLRCRYCQNAPISSRPVGKPVDAAQLRQMMEALIVQGAENIDLVTPTQYLPTIADALKKPRPVPVVFNSGGYERVETLKELEGKIQIYLPDLKYAHSKLAMGLSSAPYYFSRSTEAIREMVRQTGPVQWQGEKITRGTIIRHLILPGQVENSLKILDWIGQSFRPGEVLVSLMRQYTPMGNLPAPYDRRITDEEYDAVLSWMFLNQLEGFTQEKEAADAGFIPDFH